MKILITGANGQLGKCIKDVSIHYPAHNYLFLSRKDLDITNKEAIKVPVSYTHLTLPTKA